MDSDSDCDMSWVELAASEDKPLKRAMSASSTEPRFKAKRSRTVCEGNERISVGVQTECEVNGMLYGCKGAESDEEAQMEMDGAEMEGVPVGQEKNEHVGKEEEEVESGEEQAEDAEVTKGRERMRAEKQKERDEKNAFWTTPGLRPLAEPPILDWDWFFRVRIPSDLRFKALFPDDPEKRCRMKDLNGELAALHEYTHCAGLATDDPETDSRRREFYQHLLDDIFEDLKEVDQECDAVWAMATDLSRFEFRHLDNDGRTTRLEQWIKKGADVFYSWGDEVRQKYSYLVPQDFARNPLDTFEFAFFLDDSTNAITNANANAIANKMKEGRDFVAGWPQEVQAKYGYLRQYLPHPPPSSTSSSSTAPPSPPAPSSEYSAQSKNHQRNPRTTRH